MEKKINKLLLKFIISFICFKFNIFFFIVEMDEWFKKEVIEDKVLLYEYLFIIKCIVG